MMGYVLRNMRGVFDFGAGGLVRCGVGARECLRASARERGVSSTPRRNYSGVLAACLALLKGTQLQRDGSSRRSLYIIYRLRSRPRDGCTILLFSRTAVL